MPIDPQIALSVKPLQMENPLEMAGKALSVRNMIQTGQMNTERLKAEQMANQQNQQKLDDSKVIREAQAAAGGDIDATLKSVAGKIHPDTFLGLQKHANETKEQLGKLDEQKQKKLQFHLEQTGVSGQRMLSVPAEQKAAVWTGERQRLIDAGIDAAHLPEEYPGDEAMQAEILHGVGIEKWLDEHRKAAGEKRAIEEHAAKMAADKARLPGIEATSLTQGLEASGQTLASVTDQPSYDAWRQQNPEMAKRLPPMFNPGVVAMGQKLGMKPEQQVVTEETAKRDAETARRDAATQKHADEMLKIAKGNLNVSQQHASIAQHIYEQTYGAGANPALVGVEPKLRVQAASAASKAADEFTKAMESIHNVQSFIDLARSGNKAAGSNLPIMGAESIQALNGIKRINRTEIEQYQGAGSLLDKIQGKLGKIVAGQPISADVMKDIESLHKTISGNAIGAYNKKLEGINQNYHAQFKPVPSSGDAAVIPEAVKSVLKGQSPGIHTLSDGSKWMVAADGAITKQ